MIPAPERRRFHWYWLLAAPLGLLLAALLALASYFYPGSDTRALRSSVAKATGANPHWRIHLNVGRITLGAVQLASQFVQMPTEARLGLNSIHGVEAGVYELSCENPGGSGEILRQADSAMTSRGWERMVGVVERDQVVGVYVPVKQSRSSVFTTCVMVVDKRTLVVAKARGNLADLAAFAMKQLETVNGRGSQPHSFPSLGLAAHNRD